MPDSATSAADAAIASAVQELATLRLCSADERQVLARLRRDVVDASHDFDGARAAHLAEANERLVLAMLRAQDVAGIAARALEEAIRPAQLDPLTMLPNRLLLRDRLSQAIGNAQRHGVRLALMFVDIDSFKQINDTLGHCVGDDVLRIVGQRLKAATRTIDTVSRHGGDEFLILLSELDDAADAVTIANAAIAALAVPISVGAHALTVTASIGISFYPDDGDDAQTLIDRADIAMYGAKRDRAGLAVFDAHALARQPQPAGDAASPRALAVATGPMRYNPELVNIQMQEANGRLILAALGAQEQQAVSVRAHRQQQDFLAVMSHELRNPLASIRLACSMMKPRAKTTSARMQGIIDSEVSRMTRLVGDLLDVSRVNTGKLRVERALLDLAALVDDAVQGCRARFDARGQALAVHLPADPLIVFGDAVRLMQVVANLLDNASKYTPTGGRISVLLASADELAVLTVSDDGIGIPGDTLPTVFEPFLRTRHASEFTGVGLGIGLTVARELVEAHGGTVEAHSDGIDCGSQFIVTLPLTSIERQH